jgi:hypothetical protein
VKAKPPFSRDSLERALIHHGIDYSPPGAGQPHWRVATSLGYQQMTSREVWTFCLGLANRPRSKVTT